MCAKKKDQPPVEKRQDDDWDDWEELDEEEESFPRMSFLEHLDELRSRLFKIVIILLLAIVVSWNFADFIWHILEVPARRMLADAQEKSLSVTQKAEQLAVKIKEIPPLPEEDEELQEDFTEEDFRKFDKFREHVNSHLEESSAELEEQIRDILVAKDAKLMQTAVGEAFFLKVKISFLAGLIFSFPLLAFQIWAFVAPGLYRRERRIAIPFVFFATLFFVGGCMFGYFVAVPFAGSFLMGFGTEFVQLITINKYMDFMITMMLGLGVVFEIPMAIFLLAKIGIATPRWLLKNFRYAVLIIVVVAAIVTPTGDPVNLALFSIPMILLYLLGVGIAAIWGPKGKDERWEEEGLDEDEADDEDDDEEEDEDYDDENDLIGDDRDAADSDPYGLDIDDVEDPESGDIGKALDESDPYRHIHESYEVGGEDEEDEENEKPDSSGKGTTKEDN